MTTKNECLFVFPESLAILVVYGCETALHFDVASWKHVAKLDKYTKRTDSDLHILTPPTKARRMEMYPPIDTDEIRCPHCGENQEYGDELCRFCGQIMEPLGRSQSLSTMASSALNSLKAKITPLSQKDFQYWDTLDLSDPFDPIWDDD